MEGFWQFFKPNNSKSGHGKSKLLLLPCREFLALRRFFFFFCFFCFVFVFVFVFSPNLKFFELLRKKSQNFDFFQENTFFALFCQKFEKY